MTPIKNQMPITLKDYKLFEVDAPFELENGGVLKEMTIAYHSYGTLNDKRDNVIWVCHALTANSDVVDWWSGIFGESKLFDPTESFIVCANIIGSYYGSTGPRSINPDTGIAYGLDFPLVTVKDMAKAHVLLAKHLEVNSIEIIIGGSCGGHQVQELCLISDVSIRNAIMLVTSAKETAWSIAIHEAQRLALRADQTFQENNNESGIDGLKAARGMGLIGYRTFDQYINQQDDLDNRYSDFKASSYIRYQGEKLAKRFHAHSYFHLLNSLDTHNIGRNRGGLKNALSLIKQRTLLISINSDILIPESEQRFMADHIPQSKHVVIESKYGHDGFLVETDKIRNIIHEFLQK